MTDTLHMDPVPVGTPASPPVKQLLTLGLSDVSSDTSPVAAAKPLKQDFESPSYREALATALRWDPKRQEPYLQLPSYPELRLTPFRNGIEDEIVTLFNHPVIGERLYRLPYPMKRPFAQSWVQDDLHKHLTFCTALIAGVLDIPEDENAATTPLEPHHDVIILGLPFKSLWDTKQNRIVGDIGMSPDLEPLTPGGPLRTEDQVLASPLASQTWHLGYVLEPAAHGRGIMSEVIGVLLESWVRPIMRVENVVAIVENNNKGSHKVIDKNGFNKIKEVVTDWPVEKGGGKRYSGYYVWKRGGDGSDDERIMRNLQNRRNNMAVDVDDSDSDYAGGDISMNSSALPSPAIANLVDEDCKMMSPARSPLRESANSTD